MANTIKVLFADLICELIPENKQDLSLLRNEYCLTYLSNPPSYRIRMKESFDTDFVLKKETKNTGTYFYPKKKEQENYPDYIFYGLEAFIEYFALEEKVVFLHASSFVKNNKAYVFCGPSSVGKSTIINKLPHSQILSDDTAVLKKIGFQFWAFTSPFDNKKKPALIPQKVIVDKIFFLEQSCTTKWIRLTPEEGLRQFLNNDIFYHYALQGAERFSLKKEQSLLRFKAKNLDKLKLKLSLTRLYRLSMDLIKYIPLYRLFFTKDVSFLSDL